MNLFRCFCFLGRFFLPFLDNLDFQNGCMQMRMRIWDSVSVCGLFFLQVGSGCRRVAILPVLDVNGTTRNEDSTITSAPSLPPSFLIHFFFSQNNSSVRSSTPHFLQSCDIHRFYLSVSHAFSLFHSNIGSKDPITPSSFRNPRGRSNKITYLPDFHSILI